MRVSISAEKTITLIDATDFKRFDLAAHIPGTTLSELKSLLKDVADVEDTESAWIFTGWLLQQAAASEADWRRSFDAMIGYARKHGWVKDGPQRIRGHIVWMTPDHRGS
jgi:hypothetical protein